MSVEPDRLLIEQKLLEAQVAELEAMRGRGTSLISFYIAPSALAASALGRARARIADELGISAQIKSRV